MDWKKATALGENGYKIPERWLHIHYYEALNILFRFENSLRVFVYIILKNESKEDWTNINVGSDGESEDGTISSIAKKRISQTKKFGYLGYSISNPIMHLTSGELISLITSESCWKFFKEYFPGSKEIIKNKLDEIGTIRNSLAHFRPLREDDIEVVKQNTKQTLMLIERSLSEILQCNNIIPTNTADKWYKHFETLGAKNCRFSFYQSEDEKWIRISLSYDCPILSKRNIGNRYVYYKVLTVSTSSILIKYERIKNMVTYLSENIPYGHIDKDYNPNLEKNISFVFSKNIIASMFTDLKSSFEELLRTITEETELILQDNLARGSIIKSTSASARFKGKDDSSFWDIESENLRCKIKDNDPPEYWGQISYPNKDFVAGIEKYPWMPEEISWPESPF